MDTKTTPSQKLNEAHVALANSIVDAARNLNHLVKRATGLGLNVRLYSEAPWIRGEIYSTNKRGAVTPLANLEKEI